MSDKKKGQAAGKKEKVIDKHILAHMRKVGLKPKDFFFNVYNEPSYKTKLLIDKIMTSIAGSLERRAK